MTLPVSVRACLSAALTLLVLPPVVNAVVDPAGVWGVVDRPGFNSEKTMLMYDGGRVDKSLALARGEYGTILLGTSRAIVGLNPASPVFAGRRVYNASLPGTNFCELRDVYAYARRHQDVDTVIFGLDFLSFSGTLTSGGDYAGSGIGGRNALVESVRYLYGPQRLRQSARTVWHNVRGIRARYDADGHRRGSEDYPPPVDHREWFAFRLREDLIFREEGHYAGFVYGPQRLEALRGMLDRAAADGTAMYLFISPVHARQLETLRVLGLTDTLEQWKRGLVRVVDAAQAAAPHGPPLELWDFSGYTSPINTEPLPAPGDASREMRWYWEQSHYKEEVGDLVVARMLQVDVPGAPVPEDFGVRLTAANIDTHLERQRAARDTYARLFPQDVAEIEAAAAATAALRPTADSPGDFARAPAVPCPACGL